MVLESVAAAVKEAREATARALDPLALEKGACGRRGGRVCVLV